MSLLPSVLFIYFVASYILMGIIVAIVYFIIYILLIYEASRNLSDWKDFVLFTLIFTLMWILSPVTLPLSIIGLLISLASFYYTNYINGSELKNSN